MKKVCSMALALCCLLSTTVMAASADAAFTNSTKLTTTVPAASYVMNIPADQTVVFGAEKTDIGNVTITNASGFASGKNVQVTMTHDDFHSDSVDTTISYTLSAVGTKVSTANKELKFGGRSDGSVAETATISNGAMQPTYANMEKLCVYISSTTWGKALAGDYTSTITFTSAVVVEK